MTYQFQIFLCTNCLRHYWTFRLIDDEITAHTGQWRQNVREQNAAVRLVVTPRLQRYFHSDFGNFTPLTERRIFLTKITIGLDVATGLTHHPDGSAFNVRFPTGRANQERVFFWSSIVLGGLVDCSGNR